ncbi:restriction endonuclease subunit S [Massilicoli timonensis]|uniref:restriction endonuclease subunit S n=1 Tax=Massilicoli timonensis TaxID=2015901 RepID=UPI003AAD9E5E
MARAKKEAALTPEERLQAALVPDWEWPYKLPKNWCWTNWGECGEFVAGSGFKNEYQGFTNYDIPFYKVSSLKTANETGYLCDNTNTVDETVRKKLKAALIPANSLLFAKIGEAIRLNRRAINTVPCCVDNNMMAFIPIICQLKYAFYWSKGIDLYDFTNATTVPAIRKTDLEKISFPLAPLAEQQRIVDRIESLFTKLDEAKEKAQAVVDSFETRKAAILHKAFTGELTAKWREEHDVGMESWEQCSLSDVCTVNPKKADTKDLPDELEVSFFPMSALSEIYGEITDPQTRLLKEVRSGFTNFSEGDVVFAKITPCMENGKSAVVGKLVNDIGYGTTEFFVLRCSDRLYNRFLYHLVRDKLFRDKAKAVMAGAVGQQRVPKRYLETYKLNLPKFNEQREIVRILDGSFAKEQQTKEAAEAVLDQIELMKKSILARAFRGELGTNDPNEESAVELLKQIF